MYSRSVDSAERLIESTRQLLWSRGYVGTSPKAIQQLSGAGQGSMYHHFSGKKALALVAIERSAAELCERAESRFAAPGTAVERIAAFLRLERDVLRGCPIGRLTQDPDVIADPELRAPVERTFGWLRRRLAEVLADGVERGEFGPPTQAIRLDPASTASAVVAAMQGGYVLARAADSPEPFTEAVEGVLGLLFALVPDS